MSETEKIYSDLKIETHYDPKKEEYSLVFKDHESHFFFQKGVLEVYSLLAMNDFIYEMNRNDPEVLVTGEKYGIAPYNILHSFQETKKIEDEKLEKALNGEDKSE